MGCDIHLYVEELKTIDGKAKWVNIDNWSYNHYYDVFDNEQMYNHESVYRGRNYNLFSLLADVRNYDENEPISMPRGLPRDICHITKAESEPDDYYYSHSYFTVDELFKWWDSHGTVKFKGLISPDEQGRVRNGSKPQEWRQTTTSNNYVWYEWTEESDLKSLLKPLTQFIARKIYMDWIEDEELMEKEVRKIADKFRIVFWFDS